VVGTLAAARKALRDARSSIGDMATAQNLEHYERYWKHFLDAMKKAEKQVQYTGGAPELKFVHRLRLLPVEDGGQTYDPPPAAQGEHRTPPHELAEQAASMIEALIQDAERRFLP
jgi:hypothetical protein